MAGQGDEREIISRFIKRGGRKEQLLNQRVPSQKSVDQDQRLPRPRRIALNKPHARPRIPAELREDGLVFLKMSVKGAMPAHIAGDAGDARAGAALAHFVDRIRPEEATWFGDELGEGEALNLSVELIDALLNAPLRSEEHT